MAEDHRASAARDIDGRAPKVSIGMPVWNGEKFIGMALDSLLGQTCTDFELIISDNASTDATEAIYRRYAANDGRIRFYRSDRNVGLVANFQRVLDLATAPYFMWATDDDLWDPTYIETMVGILDREPATILAGSNAASVDEHDVPRAAFANARMYLPGSTSTMARRLISAPPQGGHATLIYGLMRTPVIKKVGLVQFGNERDPNRGEFGTDKLTLFRLLFEGQFHVVDRTMYFHRDVIAAPPRGARAAAGGPAKRRLVRRAANRIVDVHGYFDGLRRIVLESHLGAGQKASLVALSVVRELGFYVTLTVQRLAERWGGGHGSGPRPG